VRNQPSAIWDRQELPVQRKRTFNGSGTALFSRSVGHVLQACPVNREPIQVTQLLMYLLDGRYGPGWQIRINTVVHPRTLPAGFQNPRIT